MITENDMKHLTRCVELAREAVDAGDAPFGSVLVSGEGEALAEDRNRINTTGDGTQHPEFFISRWAAENLNPEERRKATVYTSGEHCPMCAAAHGWVGLGRIVYASSSEQLAGWREALGAPASPVRRIPIQEVLNGVEVDGPVPFFADEIRAMQETNIRRLMAKNG